MKFSELIKAELGISDDLLVKDYKTVKCDFDGMIKEYPIKSLVKSKDIFGCDIEDLLPEGYTWTAHLEKPSLCVDVWHREEEIVVEMTIINSAYNLSRRYIAALFRYFEKTKDEDILDVLVELCLSSDEKREKFACYMIEDWKSYYTDIISDTYKYINYTKIVWSSFDESKDYGDMDWVQFDDDSPVWNNEEPDYKDTDIVTGLFVKTMFEIADKYDDEELRHHVVSLMLDDDEGEGFVKYVMEYWPVYFKEIMLGHFGFAYLTKAIIGYYWHADDPRK